MRPQASRFNATTPVSVAPGWQLERLTQPSRLFGANGMRTGPDGRIYVAQVSGSQISAVDIETGLVEAISPMGGDIVAPDDLAFDRHGNLFVTEITEGRVSMRAPNGTTRVVYGDMPCANPIAIYQDRLFAGECRPGGRIMELDLDGGAPRVLLADVPMPNAMEVGPDGKLYFPVMGTNEIWRIDLQGGAAEKVAGDLGVPDAVKFDRDGFIVSTQVASGQVLRIDPRNGARSVLADIAPGLDNLAFVGQRLFVSSISGQINEILGEGMIRSVVPDGLNWPLGLAMGTDGALWVADGPFFYALQPGGGLQVAGTLFSAGSPGYVRGVAACGPGEVIVTTANGSVARFRPASAESETLAEGFERLYGVAIAPDGAVVFAELGSGRVLSVRAGNVEVLASALKEPMGVAIDVDGIVYVSESVGGRVVKISRGSAETVLDGLHQPHGILLRNGLLYVVDVGAKTLIEFDLSQKLRRVIASALPVGAPPGVTAKYLRAIPPLSGPMGPFTGIAAGDDGALYVSADSEGSVLCFRNSSCSFSEEKEPKRLLCFAPAPASPAKSEIALQRKDAKVFWFFSSPMP